MSGGSLQKEKKIKLPVMGTYKTYDKRNKNSRNIRTLILMTHICSNNAKFIHTLRLTKKFVNIVSNESIPIPRFSKLIQDVCIWNGIRCCGFRTS